MQTSHKSLTSGSEMSVTPSSRGLPVKTGGRPISHRYMRKPMKAKTPTDGGASNPRNYDRGDGCRAGWGRDTRSGN